MYGRKRNVIIKYSKVVVGKIRRIGGIKIYGMIVMQYNKECLLVTKFVMETFFFEFCLFFVKLME